MTVNTQIIDAIGATNAMAIGLAAPLSMGLVYTIMSESIGVVMTNAASTQHSAQSVANSASAVTCALIISKGSSGK